MPWYFPPGMSRVTVSWPASAQTTGMVIVAPYLAVLVGPVTIAGLLSPLPSKSTG